MKISEAGFNVEAQKAAALVAMEEIKATADAHNTAAQVLVQAQSAQIQGFASMAASALNVINAGVSVSGSISGSESSSQSLSESHIFYET